MSFVNYTSLDLKISENTVVNPDLLIICDEVNEQYYDKPPSLVVEVISVFSIKDTITKFDCIRILVPYFIIVDNDDQSIKIYHLVNGQYIQADTLPTIFLN
ncbi:MAG: Uma2 family endonuclease [Saprospiraceae bacterium]|nr:Uma2 family endonuclease [Saprospiraceae bacterium]